MRRLLIVPFVALMLAGCASSRPSYLNDHATTVANCGVSNYKFRYLKEPCHPNTEPQQPVAVVDQNDTTYYDTIDITQEVHFANGSTKLSKNDKDTLNDVAWVIKSNDDQIARVNVEGYTDASGDEARNLSLSRKRAQVVRNYLIGRGVDPEKLTAIGYGESMPKFNTSTATPDELSRNRRVEFTVETYDEY